ncbi:MAG TPA: TlpA disulfide reductase family protein [Dokdonella sp.]
MKSTRFLALVLAVLVGAPALAAAAADAKRPSLSIQTLDGGRFDLAKQHGRWVVVNLWATWCTPCIKEMPDLSAFVASRKDVTAIGLAYDDADKAEIAAFAKAHPVAYPLAQVDVEAPPADFDTPRGLPTTYLIAPDGTVAKKFTGPITAVDLEKAIAAATRS